jgi:hexosaminidase
MKNVLTFLMMMAVMKVSGQDLPVSIIPEPVEVQKLNGVFELTKSSTVTYNKADARATAEMLVQKLSVPTGFILEAVKGKTGSIQLNINDRKVEELGDEGYTLESTPQGVLIAANEPAGLFYGMQTLLQLLPKAIEGKSVADVKWVVPAVKILDYPRFGWRGLMLDVSRHFFSKEDVMRYIDEMARVKFNTFHWHLTDDNGWRVEIKSLPRLTEVGAWRVERAGHFGQREAPKPGEPATYGGFYTQDDIREVIAYAAERHVTIVPEIDVPGHSMAAIASYPELSCTKDTTIMVNPGSNFAEWYGDGTFKMLIDNTLNPSDERVYEFLNKVFSELAALFPNPYIHVGGDECYKGFWEKDPGCQELMKKEKLDHVEQLQGYFMNRVEKILNAKGKKLIGWDEILEGGISPGATVMSWRGMEGGIEAAKMGHDVVMTPTTFAYLDYTQGDPTIDPPIYAYLRLNRTYSFEPVPDEVDGKYILGGQGNLWTEQIPTLRYAEYMTYPRAWALAETFWSPKEKKNWENFIKRVETQFCRSDVADQNYSRAIYDPVIRTTMKGSKLWLVMESEVPDLDICYSIDDTMPDDHSAKYTEPVELPDAPITLRVVAYRGDKPMGHLITLNLKELKERSRP